MLLNAAGRRLHYDDLGPRDGPVVCMVHTLSSDAGVWSEQVPALLATGWRVVRPAYPGHTPRRVLQAAYGRQRAGGRGGTPVAERSDPHGRQGADTPQPWPEAVINPFVRSTSAPHAFAITRRGRGAAGLGQPAWDWSPG